MQYQKSDFYLDNTLWKCSSFQSWLHIWRKTDMQISHFWQKITNIFFQMSFKYPISNNITSYLETSASGIGSFQWCISELKFWMCWASSQFHALKGPPDGPNPESWEVLVHFIHCCSCSITLKSKTHLFLWWLNIQPLLGKRNYLTWGGRCQAEGIFEINNYFC